MSHTLSDFPEEGYDGKTIAELRAALKRGLHGAAVRRNNARLSTEEIKFVVDQAFILLNEKGPDGLKTFTAAFPD